mgnify:FL=1
MRQVVEAEALAKLGETIVSPEAWALVSHACQGDPCEAAPPSASTVSLSSTASKGKRSPSKGGEPMRLVACAPVLAPDVDRLGGTLLCKHLIELQRAQQTQQTHVAFHGAHRPFLQASLEAYVHETARKAIEADASIELSEIAERRVVVVGFGRVRGLDAALENGSSGLRDVQSCLATCLEPISQSGALLRQFIYDDKGVVLIWTFGQTQATFEDNPHRGLRTAQALHEALSATGLSIDIGITSGEAFCGLVGVPGRRCEYGVMGPCVNLAARLMCMCEAKGVNLLCCDQMKAELTKGRVKDVRFTSYDPVAVRGYAALVGMHHPRRDEALMDMMQLLEHVQIYALLTPREQSKFLDAVVKRSFDTGEDLIVEGDAAEHFFILMDGTVHVTKRTIDGSAVVLVPELKRGDSFGEVALITEGKRTATITATSPVVAMTISRSVFIDLFGGMADLLSNRRAGILRNQALPSDKIFEYRDSSAWICSDPSSGVPPSVPGCLRSTSWDHLQHPGGSATNPALRSSRGIADKFMLRSVGRETEARHLANRVQALLATGEPSLTLMTGEPGIGKTHLLRELRRLYGECELQVMHAEGRRHDMEPLSVWVPLLQAMLASHLQKPVAHVKLSEALDLVPPALRGHVGRLASLLDGAAKGTVRRRRPYAETGSKRHLEAECEMAVRIASHLMSLRPQLLIIDAAENLTPYAWQVLTGVLAAAPSVAVIVSSREMNTGSNGGASEELSRLRRRCMAPNVSATCRISPTLAITELQLAPLSQVATRALLANALSVRPESLDAATVAKAHERCGGNPGFLLEFCTPDISTGASSSQINEAVVRSLAELPPTVTEIVLAELDRLPVPAQQLVKIAAAIGVPFERQMLIGIYPGRAAEVDEALRSPALLNYLVELSPTSHVGGRETPKEGGEEGGGQESPVPGPSNGASQQWTIKNPAVGDVVNRLMLLSQKQKLHKQISEWYLRLCVLETRGVAGDQGGIEELVNRLAYHSSRSGDANLAKRHLLAAGFGAIKRGVYKEAERHFTECVAFDEDKTDPLYVRAAVALAEMYSRYGLTLVEDPASAGASGSVRIVAMLRSLLAAQLPPGASLDGLDHDELTKKISSLKQQTMLNMSHVCHSLAWALSNDGIGETSQLSIERYFDHAIRMRTAADQPLLAAESLAGLGAYLYGVGRSHVAVDQIRANEYYERASVLLARSLQLRAADPRYEWSVELASSLTALGVLQRDKGGHDTLLAVDTCFWAFERYSATLGPFHPRSSRALDSLWRAYLQMGEAACALAVLAMLVHLRAAIGTQDTLFMEAASMEYNALSSTFERPWRRVLPRLESQMATAPLHPTQTLSEIAPTLADPQARLASSHRTVTDEMPSNLVSKDALLLSGISLCERLQSGYFDPVEHKAAAEAAAEAAVGASDRQCRPSAEDNGGVEAGAAGRGNGRNVSPQSRRRAGPLVVLPHVRVPSNEQWEASRTELREELFVTYPELDFYIGMTLDEDGMLGDGATELKESVVASMELAVQLAALARVENPTEQPNAALARHCPALLTLAAQAMATPESLHVVLLLLAVRSLNRVSLLVHDSGARVDELSTVTVADLIESVMSPGSPFAIPSIEALASVPELATKTAILACPFRFDRFALGESNVKQLETYFQLRVSDGSVATGNATEATRTRAAQLLLVSCLGEFAPELQRAVAAIPPSRNSSEGGSTPSDSKRTAIAFLQLVHSAVDALQTVGETSAPSPSPLQASSARNSRSIGGGMDGSSHGPGGSLGGSVGEGDLTKLVSKQAQAAMKQFLRAAEGNIRKEMEELPSSFSNSLSGRLSRTNSRSFSKGGSGCFSPLMPSTSPTASLSTADSSLKAVSEDVSMREEQEQEQEQEGALSTAFVRLYCMLRWRPGAARHLQLAIEGLSDGDWGILQRELATDAEGSTSVLPARRSQLVLLDACRILQATDECSSSALTEELGVIIGTEALPSATANGQHDEMRATALRVGLECLAQLLLVVRSSVSEEDMTADFPYEVFCGNALRVAYTERAAALREKRSLRPKPDLSCPEAHVSCGAEMTLPTQLELLKAARFCVLCANPHYAHLGLEPPTDRSSDSALVHWI